MQTVADYISGTLAHSGLDVVFGYPGQSNVRLLHALRRADLRYVQMADERGAGFAAAGYALAGGGCGVVCASKGPAATNLLTPLVSAHRDGVPMLVITGNVGRAYRGKNSFQEFEPVRAFEAAAAVKAAREVSHARQVPDALRALLTIARMEPSGPVLLDLPYDLFGAPLDAEPETIDAPRRISTIQGAGGAADVDEAMRRIAAARRPVCIVGRGAREDYRAVRDLVARHDMPAIHTMGGTGVVSTSDPLYGGLLRHNGCVSAAYLAGHADLLLVLGSGLDERATGEPAAFARGAFKIQVDVDRSVFGRSVPIDLAIDETVAAFLARAEGTGSSQREWRTTFGGWRTASGDRASYDSALSAVDVVEAGARALADAIVVKDAGSHKYWVTTHAPCRSPRQSIASCHFGSMGFGLPAAIGASIARPDEDVIAVCGDGCLLMSLAELPTAARERCDNLSILVFNNAGLGSTRDFEDRTCPGAPRISDFGCRVAFSRYAAAAGMESHAIADRRQLAELDSLLRRRRLSLVDCHIDSREPMAGAISYSEPLAQLVEREAGREIEACHAASRAS